jgi:hypothetical protein
MLLVANAVALCVLSFYRTSPAAPSGQRQPFANPTEQRVEMVEQIKETNRLLREQNALLRSGKLTVVVAENKK